MSIFHSLYVEGGNHMKRIETLFEKEKNIIFYLND